jgi:hypothetical protein
MDPDPLTAIIPNFMNWLKIHLLTPISAVINVAT